MKGKGLILNMCIYQVSYVDLGGGRNVRERDLADVVHEVCCETNHAVHNYEEVSVPIVSAAFVTITFLDAIYGKFEDQRMCHVQTFGHEKQDKGQNSLNSD